MDRNRIYRHLGEFEPFKDLDDRERRLVARSTEVKPRSLKP